MDEAVLLAALGSGIRLSTPLILCALGGLLSERAGVVDIALEGKMLFAAFMAGSVAAVTGSPTLAIAAAVAVAVVLGWLHGLACVSHAGDQVVSGLAINIIAAGLTMVWGSAWFAQGGQTPPLPDAARLQPLFGKGPLSHSVLVYLAYALVPAVWWMLHRTRLGLRLRAVGENPHMVEAAGVSVTRLRYLALTLCGALCGLAGSFLVLSLSAGFSQDMTAGRGFMALAALIFGRWRPFGALGACLLFGALDAMAIQLQGVALPGVGVIPVQGIQMLPYLLTLVLLGGFMGRAQAPAALGLPYRKDR